MGAEYPAPLREVERGLQMPAHRVEPRVGAKRGRSSTSRALALQARGNGCKSRRFHCAPRVPPSRRVQQLTSRYGECFGVSVVEYESGEAGCHPLALERTTRARPPRNGPKEPPGPYARQVLPAVCEPVTFAGGVQIPSRALWCRSLPEGFVPLKDEDRVRFPAALLRV